MLISAIRQHISKNYTRYLERLHAWTMPISARNQLEGKVVEVTLGDLMTHAVVKIGKSRVESVMTRRSAEELALKKGDKVTVVIKSTEVMLQKD
jgi:molybdopterin-binding protein